MKILMAAGGTGGHVFPALAIAAAFQERHRDAQIMFVGTPKGMEGTLVPAAGFPLELMKVAGLKGKGMGYRLRSLAGLPGAFLASWSLLRRFKPDAVFGIGGYASGPILLVAALTRCRTAILEPNAVAGFSNRVLGKFVDRVFVAFACARRYFADKKVIHSGNPIRKEILAVAPPSFADQPFTVLVFGGSQGAQAINQAVMDALPLLKKNGRMFHFVHQTGQQDEERVRQAYREHGVTAEVFAFSGGNMAEAFARSHLVLARAGSSVLEIAACGRPSILVPYPFAADDHQRANARVMERAQAALYVENEELSGSWLAKHLTSLAGDARQLEAMSKKALNLRYACAAEEIVQEIEEMVG